MKASVRGGIKNVVNSGSKKRKSVQRRDDKSSNDDGAADVEHDSSNEVGAQSSSSSSEDEWAENESSDEDALAVAEAAAQVCLAHCIHWDCTADAARDIQSILGLRIFRMPIGMYSNKLTDRGGSRQKRALSIGGAGTSTR